MAEFGRDFDLPALEEAARSTEPETRNKVAAFRLGDLKRTRNVVQHGYPINVRALHEAVNTLRTELGPFVERFSD